MGGTAPVLARAVPSGPASPLASFDREMEEFIRPRKIPGAALAVVRDRRLVYIRGYGLADRDLRERVWPTSLFRIASISKPVTAAAVLKLVEQGKLRLDAGVLDLLDVEADESKPSDERWSKMTLRHLLQHSGGWDRDRSYDPMFRSREIALDLGMKSPAGPREVIRYMLGRPLDFDPGERYAYSNLGYCILGRIIERVSGVPYEQYVRQHVLTPLGIQRMRLGRSLEPARSNGETRYYMPDDEPAESVFDEKPGKVPWPYGGFCLEAMDAHGGWIASVADLARFAAAFHDPARCPLLKAATIGTMYAPPAPPVSRNGDGSLKDFYYGCGWFVRPAGETGKANCWHTGSLPGTYGLLVRRSDGLSWVVLFNQRSKDRDLPDNAIDPALHRAADAVKDWPDEDLFGKHP